MKISDILDTPSIVILLYIYEKGGEVRHKDLEEKIGSRGTLVKSIGDLMEEKLVEKRVIMGKPIKSFYYLTSKGKEIAKKLYDIRKYYV